MSQWLLLCEKKLILME